MSKPDYDPRGHGGMQTFCLLTLTFIAVGAALYFLRPVLVPFTLAVFLVNCLIPLIEVQQRYLRLPRSMAIASTLIVAMVAVTLSGSLLATSIGGASHRLKDYEKKFEQLTASAAKSVPLERLGIKIDKEDVARTFAVGEGTGWQFISAVLGEATSVISSGVTVIIFMLFLLVGTSRGRHRADMFSEIEGNVQRYVVVLVIFSLGTAILAGSTLALLGVDLAWVFGFLTFLLNFVPTVGAIVAALLPLPVIVLSPDMSLTAKVLAILIPATIHFVVGSLVQPRFQGNALALHPVVVLLSLMFFGMIWGITGAFLAAPITAVLRIICGRIPLLQPLAEVLSGNLAAVFAEHQGVGTS